MTYEAEAGETLGFHQKVWLVRFVMACPEMRDDQVETWSRRHPDLADGFQTAADAINENREEIEREREALGPEECERRFRATIEREFAGSPQRVWLAYKN